ncbi:short-chain dehydrogenase/reductase [Acrasis kona]|uniref:3-oxoacyl-[acyl-carrier-protein] reductase FabG n=1 Tax=Acrasis kona TaxID=1008807 RepID=A0AAW2YXD7_9EUKA
MSMKSSSFGDLSGKTALITGGGTGIGLMIARAFVSNGARTIIVGRRIEKLESAKKTLDEEAGNGGSAEIMCGDVSTRSGIEKIVSDFESGEQRVLDILVCNAGIYRSEEKSWNKSLSPEELSNQFLSSRTEDWIETLTVNTVSPYHLSGAFIPHLSRSSGPNIIVTSSIAGVHWSANSSNPSYSASKSAMNHLVKIMANRLAPIYIRVNAIAPGLFPSEMTEDSPWIKQAITTVPAKRMGNDQEMGFTALYLANCGYINGQVLVVDGGRSLMASGQ